MGDLVCVPVIAASCQPVVDMVVKDDAVDEVGVEVEDEVVEEVDVEPFHACHPFGSNGGMFEGEAEAEVEGEETAGIREEGVDDAET